MMIKLQLKPITDTDPVILNFKQTCLQEMGEPRYISWIQPLVMSRTPLGGIALRAPTPWFAQHISTNDMLDIGLFLHKIKISEVMIINPNGSLAGKIFPTPPKGLKENHRVFDIKTPVEKAA